MYRLAAITTLNLNESFNFGESLLSRFRMNSTSMVGYTPRLCSSC